MSTKKLKLPEICEDVPEDNKDEDDVQDFDDEDELKLGPVLCSFLILDITSLVSQTFTPTQKETSTFFKVVKVLVTKELL